MTKIRKPGESFVLTDDELLVAPYRMLTAEQKARRRRIKRTMVKQRMRREREASTATPLKYCQGHTRGGLPCNMRPKIGAKHCHIHLTDAEKEALGVMHVETGATRGPSKALIKTKTTAPQLLKETMEVAVDKLVSRYFKALGLEFQGFDEEGNPVVVDLGMEQGLALHGESKDGEIRMSSYPDLVQQVAIMEKLLDRVYGKAKQTTILEGGTKPIQVAPVRSVDRAQAVASLLKSHGAIPHEGRRRVDTPEKKHDTHDTK